MATIPLAVVEFKISRGSVFKHVTGGIVLALMGPHVQDLIDNRTD
jgi:hypothetical protein